LHKVVLMENYIPTHHQEIFYSSSDKNVEINLLQWS